MSKIFSFPFKVPNDSTISSLPFHPCRAQLFILYFIFRLIIVVSLCRFFAFSTGIEETAI